VGGAVCERCRGGRIYNVVGQRCMKGSLALSALVFVEAAVHRLLDLYNANVTRFVVPSRFVIDKLVQWGWLRERFVHIPNFVDCVSHKPATEAGAGFVYFGRLSPEKGLSTFIEAAAIADVPVTILGAGSQEIELRALAERLGTQARFLGHRSGRDLHDA